MIQRKLIMFNVKPEMGLDKSLEDRKIMEKKQRIQAISKIHANLGLKVAVSIVYI